MPEEQAEENKVESKRRSKECCGWTQVLNYELNYVDSAESESLMFVCEVLVCNHLVMVKVRVLSS